MRSPSFILYNNIQVCSRFHTRTQVIFCHKGIEQNTYIILTSEIKSEGKDKQLNIQTIFPQSLAHQASLNLNLGHRKL